MDQGIAALLGAAVGVTGTLGTTWITQLASRRQAHDQREADHCRQIREERREAYLAFMEAAEPLDHVLHVLLYRSDPPPEDPPEPSVLRTALDDLERAMPGLYKAHLRLAITGPEGMWGYGRSVWGSVRTLRAFLEDTLRGDIQEYYTYLERQADGLEDAREMFAGAANSVLMGTDAGFELGYSHAIAPSRSA